jgi:2-amino-4-hydroxy-6-hydroxymethyldihydropteridine diphosphokinase
MILVALGANLPSPIYGGPVETLTAALAEIRVQNIEILNRSHWYETAPVPMSDQPWYVNGVVSIATDLAAGPLLARLHEIEATFGRVRGTANAARILDLDLLAYHDQVEHSWPVLPHPRLHQRAFVLQPLRDVAPKWRHPAMGATVGEMLSRIGPEQQTRPLLPSAEQL